MRAVPSIVRHASAILVRLLGLGTLAYAGAALFSDVNPVALWAQTDTVPALVLLALSVPFAVCVVAGPKLIASAHRIARPLATTLAVACFADAMVYLRAVGSGRMQVDLPIPVGLLTGTLLLVFARTSRYVPVPRSARTQRDLWNKVLDRAYP